MESILDDVKEILQRREQLEAMKESVMKFEKQLNLDGGAFLVKYLDFSKEDNQVHVFEVLKRALEKEHIK